MAKYRLQALLEIRERAEEAAKQVFAEAQQALRAEEETLEQFKQELKDMVADRLRRAAAVAASFERHGFNVDVFDKHEMCARFEFDHDEAPARARKLANHRFLVCTLR